MLSVELVPKTAWWSNVRSNISRADWEKCKQYAKTKWSTKVCVICGESSRAYGKNYDTEAHEVWVYDDDNKIQTLVEIVPLCTRCHQVKHWGRSELVMSPQQLQALMMHVCAVNDWTSVEFRQYLEVETKIWAMRSNVEWELDLSLLEEILGRAVEVTDRGT